MSSTQLTTSPVSVCLASLEGLRASSVKFSSFGTLKPGTFRQVQFRPLVVKAAVVIPPKYTSIKPLGDRVLVKINEAEEKTVGGILLPSPAQSKHQVGEGEVVAVGEETTIGRPKAGITLLIGLQIMYTNYARTEVNLNGVKHVILKEDDILALVTNCKFLEEATEFYRSGPKMSETDVVPPEYIALKQLGNLRVLVKIDEEKDKKVD